MLYGIPKELCFGDKNIARILFSIQKYRTDYKYKDHKDGLWILENHAFYTKQTGLSKRTLVRKFQKMKEHNLITYKTVFHPYRRRNTLAIKLKKNTLKTLGIYVKNQSAKTTRCLPTPKCQKASNQSAKKHGSPYYTKYYSKLLLADAKTEGPVKEIEIEDFRGEKNMKKKTDKFCKKGLEAISKKSSKSMKEILEESKKPKHEDSVILKNTKPKSVEIFFKKLMAVHFPHVYTVSWSGRELGYCKTLVSKVEEVGLNIETLLRQCFGNWELFGAHVQRNKNFLKELPDFPNIGFLAFNYSEFLNFKPHGEDGVQVIALRPKRRTGKEFLAKIKKDTIREV